MKKTDKIIFSVFFLLAMQPFYGILALFIKKWGIMKIFSFLCCFITLAAIADDLTLPDGSTYRNYKIKSVKDSRVTLAYILPDGSPDIAELPLVVFPQEVQARYQAPVQTTVQAVNWKAGKNMPEKLTLALTQLQYDLARAGSDNSLRRHAADILYRQLLAEIAQTAESTDLQVNSIDSNGTLVKVVGTAAGAILRSGEYLYLSNFKAVYPFFKMKIFNSGVSVKTVKYGTVPVWAANENSAGKSAAEFLSSAAGDNTLFAVNTAVPVVNTAAPSVPVVINNNNYYSDNDDDDSPWVIYRYIDRPGRRPHKPGFKPPQNPGKPLPGKPGKPAGKPQKPAVKPVLPENTQHYPLMPNALRPVNPAVPVTGPGLELMPEKTAIPVKNKRL